MYITAHSVKFYYCIVDRSVLPCYIVGLDRSSRRFLDHFQHYSVTNSQQDQAFYLVANTELTIAAHWELYLFPMIDMEQLGSVIEDAYKTARKFREVVDAMDTEKWEQFDGTPVGEIFDNLMDLEHSLGLDKPSNS